MANQPEMVDWHPAQVKAALEMAGTNLAQLAKKHEYRHINEVLNRPWHAVERIVAKALGREPQEIWPSRYTGSRERATKLTRNLHGIKALAKKSGRRAAAKA